MKPFECKLCNYKCSLNANLKSHVKYIHKELQCAICDSKFATKHSMNAHYETAHEGKKPLNVKYVFPVSSKN